MREADFSGSTFNGAYLEKAVAFKTNFTGKFLLDLYFSFSKESRRFMLSRSIL